MSYKYNTNKIKKRSAFTRQQGTQREVRQSLQQSRVYREKISL
jgi:hypothetical protein